MGWNDRIDFLDDEEFRKQYYLEGFEEEPTKNRIKILKKTVNFNCLPVVTKEYSCEKERAWEAFLFSITKPFGVEESISALTALMREKAELGEFEKVHDLSNLVYRLAKGDPDAEIFWHNNTPDIGSFCWSTEGEMSPLSSYWESYEFLLDGFLYYIEPEEE